MDPFIIIFEKMILKDITKLEGSFKSRWQKITLEESQALNKLVEGEQIIIKEVDKRRGILDREVYIQKVE